MISIYYISLGIVRICVYVLGFGLTWVCSDWPVGNQLRLILLPPISSLYSRCLKLGSNRSAAVCLTAVSAFAVSFPAFCLVRMLNCSRIPLASSSAASASSALHSHAYTMPRSALSSVRSIDWRSLPLILLLLASSALPALCARRPEK